MEGHSIPIRKVGEFVPETPKEHRETLKHLVVSFSEPRALESQEAESHPVLCAFESLKADIARRYPDPLAARGVARFVLNSAPETLANALGFARTGEVAAFAEGDGLALDDRGQLVFRTSEGDRVLMRPAASGLEIVGFYAGEYVPGTL